MLEPTPIKIDIDAVMRNRLPRHYKYIPKAIIKGIERLICQKRINEVLVKTAGLTGAPFCEAVLKELNVTYRVHGIENIPETPRVTFASNHPLGGLDGIALIDFITQTCGTSPKCIVNDLLMAVEPLKEVFLPINKHGAQSRASQLSIDAAFNSSSPLLVFPAGLVSRKVNGIITDLQWKKMFVTKSIATNRPIIPVYFSGTNSRFFYNFAKAREHSGIKLNIEMVLLPREVFRCQDKCFDIYIGAPIHPQSLNREHNAIEEATRIKGIVYSLPQTHSYDKR